MKSSVLTSSRARNCIFKLLTIEVIHDIRPTSLSTSYYRIHYSLVVLSILLPSSVTLKYLELIYFASLRKHKVKHRTSPAYPPQSLHLFIHPFNLSSTMLYTMTTFRHMCITIRISMPNTHDISLYTKYLNITCSTQSIINVKTMVM